uniref:MADF domain-containing protein n=1 Tax=Ditylenchus dipsaci TaxID=166011 RepID=A0A915DQ29_9BILA
MDCVKTQLGLQPEIDYFNLKGLGRLDWDQLMSAPAEFWNEECASISKYLNEQMVSPLLVNTVFHLNARTQHRLLLQDDAPADHRKVDRRGKVAHRLSYTLEQEVQIWKVFLEEYKAGNAEVKAKTKWKAIEAHFRRKMLPRIWSFRRHLPMEDFQILLRFFKVKLTKKQVRRLEDNLSNCHRKV